MSEYDLKKSKKIGQLYPVLLDAKGNVIDGFHRLEADPNWRTEKLPEVNTEEKLLVARCVANWHRRQVSREEKEEWINGLARIYKKQGLVTCNSSNRNEILNRVVDVSGLHENTVRVYLHDEFKHKEMVRTTHKPRVRASQAIISKVGDEEYGRRLVERHREEVEQELRPKIEREVRDRIIEEEIKPEVKEELSRDTEFIIETIKKAPEVLPTLPKESIKRAKEIVKSLTKEMGVKEGTVYTVGEYECPHCKKHYLIKCNGKKDWVE